MTKRLQGWLVLMGTVVAAIALVSVDTGSTQIAGGELSPVETLSEAGRDACCVRIGVDAAGNAVYVWRIRYSWPSTPWGIQARTRSATGVLGPVRTIVASSERGAGAPKVAVDPDGNATIVWVHGSSYLTLRTLSAAGALGPFERLAANVIDSDYAGDGTPKLAVDVSGDTVITWLQHESAAARVKARTRSAAGVLGSVQTLSPPSPYVFEHQLAVGAGTAVSTWVLYSEEDFMDPVQTRVWAGGAWGSLQRMAPPDWNRDLRVAVAPDGRAVFAWTRHDDSAPGNLHYRVRAADGTLGRTRRLTVDGGNRVEIAMAPDGRAVFSYHAPGADGTWVLRARSLAPDGTLGAVRPITDALVWPRIGVDAAGNAVIAWSRFDSSRVVMEARGLSAAGAVGPVRRIAPGEGLAMAVAPSGTAVFAWEWHDGSNWRIRARSLAPE